MSRKSIAEGKVNVDSIVRKIIGLKPSSEVPFSKLSSEEKRIYWTVANVFRRTSEFRTGRATCYKTGLGMKCIEDFVNRHAAC